MRMKRDLRTKFVKYFNQAQHITGSSAIIIVS